MITKLAIVTILVRDQDEALRYYTEKLGFAKRADIAFGNERWVTVAPIEQTEVQIALLLPNDPLQVGKSTTWSFQTGDCHATYKTLKERGVLFVEPPTERSYGIEAVFEDLYGNRFSLLQLD